MMYDAMVYAPQRLTNETAKRTSEKPHRDGDRRNKIICEYMIIRGVHAYIAMHCIHYVTPVFNGVFHIQCEKSTFNFFILPYFLFAQNLRVQIMNAVSHVFVVPFCDCRTSAICKCDEYVYELVTGYIMTNATIV